MSVVDVVVAREAIYDRDFTVTGYELLFRSVDDTLSSSRADDPDLMTADVLFGSLSLGVDRLVDHRTVLCRVGPAVLRGEMSLTLPATRTVLQIDAATAEDPELLDGCRALLRDGYRLAVVQPSDGPLPAELDHLVSLIRIDVSRVDRERLAELTADAQHRGVEVAATHIEDAELLAVCRELGFDYYAGHALSRPRAVSGRALETSAVGRMQIAASLVGEEFDVDDLERIIRTEPGLSFQILQLASLGGRNGTRREVRTLREAIVLVGARRLQSWTALLLLSRPGANSRDDVTVALIRARMAELLAGRISPWFGGLGFTAGMVSAFDLLLGITADELLDRLPLSDDLREAAFGDTSAVGRLIRDIIDYQAGTFTGAGLSEVSEQDLALASTRALNWALDATRGLLVA